jgi:hypothetical protein
MSLLTTMSDNITLRNIKITDDVPDSVRQNLKMSEFLSECKLTNGSMFTFPIHMGVHIQDTTLLETETIHKDTKLIENQYNIPLVIQRLYSKVSEDQEVSWRDWIFFSLKTLRNMIKINKQDHYIEIASSYLGMGWVRLLCWDKILQKFFIHSDGGENIYTQNDHQDYFHDEVDTPKGFNLTADTSKVFTFDDFLIMDQNDFNKKMYKMPF